MFLAFGFSSSSLLQTYLDIVVVRPFFHLSLLHLSGFFFLPIGTGTSCLSPFLQKIVYLSSCFSYSLEGGEAGACIVFLCFILFDMKG